MPTNSQNSNNISSRSGRRWLQEAKKAARTGVANSEAQPKQPQHQPTGFRADRIDEAEELPFSKLESRGGESVHEIVTVAIPFVEETSVADKTPVKTATAAIPLAQPVSEKSPPVTTNDNQPDNKDSASKVRVPASDPPPTTSSIVKLADQIVERFPLAASTIILFAGTEESAHTDETCARVSAELAGRRIGSVLLIDSDFPNRNLSIASGMREKPGLREIVAMGMDWQQTVLRNSNSQLDFMPAGLTNQSRWNANKQLHKAAAQMRSEYQFICVSIGDAHAKAARLWSEVCDATYLLVSIENSNQDIAKSAVNVLSKMGARLQGCVVTETS